MRSQRVSLTVKLTPGKDNDLIEWWLSIAKGERQPVMKAILREYIERNSQNESRSKQLERIQDDTTWLRTALKELPTYLEMVLANGATRPNKQSELEATEQLSKSEAARREKRISKASW